jgi:hypothetical protein
MAMGHACAQGRALQPQPDTKAILGTYLPGQEWSACAIDAGKRFRKEVVNAILALPWEPCIIARFRTSPSSLSTHKAFQRKYEASGPPPSASREDSQRELGLG